jgi:GAF domain-containing protein
MSPESTIAPNLSELNLILQLDDPEVVFSRLLPVLGEILQCDRCFLYLRNPANRMGKATHCWRRNSQIPEVLDPDWKPEPENLPEEDPMFAAALRAKPSIYVEDVETAAPEVLNREFERSNFGHRALIHAHLRQDGKLWGVLQPCVFNQPRHWTDSDHSIVERVERVITPLAIAYVLQHQN